MPVKMERYLERILFAALIGVLILGPNSPNCLASERNAPSQRPPRTVPIRVGVFNGGGAAPECVLETYEALRIDQEIHPSYVSAVDISLGKLKDLDVIVFPGGSGSREYNNLGLGLRETLRDFVLKEGKGIVGICAGAYLISDTEGYPCLNLIDAHAVDREHDERGSALAEVSFSEKGLAIFPEMKGYANGYIQYHDGPLFIPSKGQENPAYEELAKLKSDIHLTGNAPAGMTPGKPLLLCQEAGKGRVFACAGHPEGTAGMRWIVPRMARWAAKKNLIPYSADAVRPSLNGNEIMHSDSLETELFWRLFDTGAETRMSALQKLVEMRYRSGVRWAVGMLRDTGPNVRSFAAQVLIENECTAAIPDIEAAIRVEKDTWCRMNLEAYLIQLKQMCHE
jgi:hypothetical protein